MSITFTPNLQGDLPTLSPCLCTQMHEDFVQWMDYGPAGPAVMRKAAAPDCSVCEGEGIEHSMRAAYPELNMSNAHALAVLGAMGIDAEPEGIMSIAQVRRGLMRARARKSLAQFTAPKTIMGRFFEAGVSETAIAYRVEKFSKFTELVASLGATKIFWY